MACIAAAAWSAGAAAQSRHTENTLKLDDPANRPKASIADIAWLAGSWRGDAFGGQAEEIWSQPAAGSMMGMFKLTHRGRPSLYEFQLIVEEHDTLTFRLRHFDARFHGWEDKETYVAFPLVRISADSVHFAGLTFHRTGPDDLLVYVATERDGTVEEQVLRYRRVKS